MGVSYLDILCIFVALLSNHLSVCVAAFGSAEVQAWWHMLKGSHFWILGTPHNYTHLKQWHCQSIPPQGRCHSLLCNAPSLRDIPPDYAEQQILQAVTGAGLLVLRHPDMTHGTWKWFDGDAMRKAGGLPKKG